MLNFVYNTPTKVLFGRGCEEKVGELVKQQGVNSVLIHYGSQRVVKNGLIALVERKLDEEGIRHVSLGGVVANPHLGKVREGIELARQNDVELVLAVGGGSVIDSSKAIAYGLAEPEHDVWELYEHTRTAKACYPVASILTIAAAGSEMSNSSVITRAADNSKRAYDDDLSRPKFAIMNPEFTVTLPDYQTESGCADIMMHTMERYFNNGGYMELTDEIAEGLLRTVMHNALILHTDPDNYDARAEVMWASSLAHNGLTGCGTDGGDWAVHMMEHEMGGMFDVTHGAGLAAIWGSWARYVYKNCLPRFVRFAEKVHGIVPQGSDEVTALKGIEAMEEFYGKIGMPINFRELGIDPTDEQIEEMAASDKTSAEFKAAAAKFIETKDDTKNNAAAVDALIPELEKAAKEGCPLAPEVLAKKDYLAKKSVWIFGGDGWAYDIGFGGLDHVLASGENVNVMVFDTEMYSNTGGQASKASNIGEVCQFAAAGKEVGKKSLAEIAMSYGYVYVAQIALGANPAQAVKAIAEAESYPGPSLIIGYAPCELHGIAKGGMNHCQDEMKKAVKAGYWNLFSFDPAKKAEGKNPFTLTSKEGDGSYQEFLNNEARYTRLIKPFPERAEKLFAKSEKAATERYKHLQKLVTLYGQED